MYHLHLIKRRHLDERKTLTKVSTRTPLTTIPQNKSAHLGTRKPGKTYANSKTTGKRSRHGRNQQKRILQHWIDHLESEGHIAQCKPNDFKFEGEWLPLYTRAGITKYVSSVSSLIKTQGDSPLIAVVPPDMLFQLEREYVIRQLHEADCLSRVTIYYGENQQKQLAFCPYCGVMNENATTAYSHARKHLGITFLCGGCYNKIYWVPQHLVQHRRSCRPCLMSKLESSRQSVQE